MDSNQEEEFSEQKQQKNSQQQKHSQKVTQDKDVLEFAEMNQLLEQSELSLQCAVAQEHLKTNFFCVDKRCFDKQHIMNPYCLQCKAEQVHPFPNHKVEAINIQLLSIIMQIEQSILSATHDNQLFKKAQEVGQQFQQYQKHHQYVVQSLQKTLESYKEHVETLNHRKKIQQILNKLIRFKNYNEYVSIKNELLEYMEIVETEVNEKKEKQLQFIKPDTTVMNKTENLIKAKYKYLDFCNTVTNEFNFEKIMNMESVEEVNAAYEKMRFNLIEKFQLINTKDSEKYITDLLNVQEFVEDQRNQMLTEQKQQREELRAKFNKMQDEFQAKQRKSFMGNQSMRQTSNLLQSALQRTLKKNSFVGSPNRQMGHSPSTNILIGAGKLNTEEIKQESPSKHRKSLSSSQSQLEVAQFNKVEITKKSSLLDIEINQEELQQLTQNQEQKQQQQT